MRRVRALRTASRPTASALFVRALAALLSVSASVLMGCEGGGPTAMSVEIVDETGGNPVLDVARGTLTLRVAQDGATDVLELASISGGSFDLSLPIGSYAARTVIEATIEDDAGPTLVGATVPFVPLGYGRVRIVVGAPETCVALSSPHLPAPVESAGLALHGSNLLLFGGLASGETRRSDVHLLSPIELTLPTVPLEVATLAIPMGRTRALSLGTTAGRNNVLIVSDTSNVVFDASRTVTGARDTLIEGLAPSADSVLVALGDLGAAVVGTTAITFVDPTGAITHTRALRFSRTGAAAARLGDGILVAGGGRTGDDVFEWHPAAQAAGSLDEVAFGAGLAQRVSGSLAVSPTSDAAILLLGRSPDDDTLVPGSLVVTGCPTRCTTEAGPDPDAAALRSGAIPVPRAALSAGDYERPATTLLVGGDTDVGSDLGVPSGATTSVRWDGTTPVLAAERGLVTPRSGHAALALGASIVLVAGGTGPTRVLDDLELCF